MSRFFIQLVNKKNHLLTGMKSSLPIAVGYIPIALTFGVVASSINMSVLGITMMSALVFAGASQFVAINLLAGGAGIFGVILTTFFVNLRHLLMSATTTEKLKHENKGWLALIAFGITDESFSLLATDSRKSLPRSYVLGLISVPYLSWVVGSAAGAILGGRIPALLESSMEIALYAMFIGLIIPEIKTSRLNGLAAFTAVLISSIFYLLPAEISESWVITFATLLSALAATSFAEMGDVDGDS